MKVVHSNKRSLLSKHELLNEAKEAEAISDWKKAEAAYKEILHIDPHHEPAYNRLMIIYRKEKEPAKEFQLVKKAIKVFEEMYATASKTKDKKVSRLSHALLKAAGMVDVKGKPVYEPEPLAKWKRRKTILEKKLATD